MAHRDIYLNNWEDLVKCYHELDKYQFDWIFRGHRKASWHLSSTLERAVAQRFRIPFKDLPDIELALLRSFQRGAHNYIDNPPSFDDTLEWYSLMQHAGAPTRLLDWTYSFYVALFFAIEGVMPDESCAVWAINILWMVEQGKKRLSKEAKEAIDSDPRVKLPSTVDKIMSCGALVFPFNPYRLSTKLRTQQGLFLAATDVTESFMKNLAVVASGSDSEGNLLKIIVTLDLTELKRILMELRRMNVTAETLFPGVEGFARALRQKIAMREAEIKVADITIPRFQGR